MHRLVIWGFVLASVPFSIAIVWELIMVVRSFVIQMGRKEPIGNAPVQER